MSILANYESETNERDMPLRMPLDSKIPDSITSTATAEEYDSYFNIIRDNPGLLEWSRSCLDVHMAQIKDLDRTLLSTEERNSILQGMLLVIQVTLEKWVKAYDVMQQDTSK